MDMYSTPKGGQKVRMRNADGCTCDAHVERFAKTRKKICQIKVCMKHLTGAEGTQHTSTTTAATANSFKIPKDLLRQKHSGWLTCSQEEKYHHL